MDFGTLRRAAAIVAAMALLPGVARAQARDGKDLAAARAAWVERSRAGSKLFDEGRYAEALECYEAAAEIAGGIGEGVVDYQDGPLCPSASSVMIGALLAARGEYDAAEKHFAEAASFASRYFDGGKSEIEGMARSGLAFVQAARGKYDEAVRLDRLALSHYENSVQGGGVPMPGVVGRSCLELALEEIARDRFDSATVYLDKAEAVQEVQRKLKFGPKPVDEAVLRVVRGHLRWRQGRLSEAADLHAEGLQLARKVREGHPLEAFALVGLGEVELARGRLDQAEGHFRSALKVREAALGREHRELAYCLDGLGRVAAARGRAEEAAEHLRRAAAILKGSLGPDHPDTRRVAAHLDAVRNPRPEPRDKPRAVGKPGPKGRPAEPARFLAIPSLLGDDEIYHGKEWRHLMQGHRRATPKAPKPAPPRPKSAGPVQK
ncbi:MAG TPA: tetratricopeptide repeat protein [Isosphaeraceae bacterium]|jgi:tetratricopeptide (TPR) repeat protein|nr:tetratricopeptide repeat protein [Isosphaeraceae bacterium]